MSVLQVEVSVQLSAISVKIGEGTGDGDTGTSTSIGSVFMAKVADGLGGDPIVDFRAMKLLFLLPKGGKREDCLIGHCS